MSTVDVPSRERGSAQGGSLENGQANVGGGAGEREIIWKRREEVVVRERAEALERQRLADYIVWRKRDGFQERSRAAAGGEGGAGDRETGARIAEKVGKEAVPEIIWRKREEEGQVERKGGQASQRAHETVWRKRERE